MTDADVWKPIDDFVLCHGGVWQIIRQHQSGSIEVTTAEPKYGHEEWVERNLHIHDRWSLIPNGEVIAYRRLPSLSPAPSAAEFAILAESRRQAAAPAEASHGG